MGDRRFEVRLVTTARRSLDRLPADSRRRVIRALRGLEIDPRPRGAVRLVAKDQEPVWRIRVGEQRVLYEIRETALITLVALVILGFVAFAYASAPRHLPVEPDSGIGN